MGYLLISKESMKGSSLGAFFKRGTGDVDKVILLTSLLISSLILIFIFGIYGLIISLGMNLISLYFVTMQLKNLTECLEIVLDMDLLLQKQLVF